MANEDPKSTPPTDTAESIVALVLFAIALIGTWMLYHQDIVKTTKQMLDYFSRS